jgi:hypothetical protein
MRGQQLYREPSVPFDPRRHLTLVKGGHAEPRNTRRFLQRTLPDSWRFAQQMAVDLARQVEFLAWVARAETFDTFFLRQAEAILRPEGLIELINGHGQAPAEVLPMRARGSEPEERAARFVVWGRAIITAVLLDLGERLEISNPHQALVYLLSREFRFAKAAALWTAEHGMTTVEQSLRELPGHALILLAASPNDTAERFMARDAFWAAVINRT